MERRESAACILLVSVAVLVLACQPVRDLDAWWHLATGRLVLASGVPRVDPFSFALDGKPWVSFEWLAEALFWLAYRAAGPAGLILLKGSVAAAGTLFAWRAGRERPVWAALLCGLSAAAARPWLVERPFVFDLLGVGLASAIIGDGSAPGRRAWLLVLLAALWANLHGAAGLIAGGMALAAGFMRGRRWLLVGAAALAAVLLTPHGWGVLEVAWRTFRYPGKELILEWNPPWRELRGPCGLWALAALPAMAAAWRRGSPWALWTAGALAAALSAQRALPLLLLCAPACLAQLEPPGRRWWERLAGPARFGLAALAVAVAAGAAVASSGRFGLGEELPLKGAAAFLEREGISGRLFNEYETGGPLIFHAAGRRKVFIDGRNAEYPPEVFRAALAWHQPAAWAALDARWGFTGAVVRRHPTGAWTTHTLDSLPSWRLVYWDDEAMVYLKDLPENAGRIARLGYRLVQPGRGSNQWVEEALASRDGTEAVLAELARSMEQAPRCVNARLLASYALARAGRLPEAEARAREAAALVPDQALPRVSLAWVLERRGDSAAAEAAYREALAAVPREGRAGVGADVLNNLGRLAERRGDRPAAAALYRRALSWNPGQGHALANLRRLEGI